MYSKLVILVLVAVACQGKTLRKSGPLNTIIESPPETNFGTWGEWDHCDFGKGIQAVQLRTEPFQGSLPSEDDTAANAIRFFCGAPGDNNTKILTSKQGTFGDWGGIFVCKSDDLPGAPDGYVTGFQLRVEPEIGFGDDSATNNIRIFCSFPDLGIGEITKEADGLYFGDWTTAQRCSPNQRACGFQTQVEDYQGNGDDTSLNNIRVECCDT